MLEYWIESPGQLKGMIIPTIKVTLPPTVFNFASWYFSFTLPQASYSPTSKGTQISWSLDQWKLSWKTHISYICNKANRTLGFLHRNLRTCPTHLKEQACKQLVFPILEYCAPIWDPYLTTEVNILESLPRWAIRFVLNKPWIHSNTDTVTEMLSNLKWSTLWNHRKYLRLILLLIIFKQYLNITYPLSQDYHQHDQIILANLLIFSHPVTLTNFRFFQEQYLNGRAPCYILQPVASIATSKPAASMQLQLATPCSS